MLHATKNSVIWATKITSLDLFVFFVAGKGNETIVPVSWPK